MPMGFFLANANMHGCLHHHSHLQWDRDNWYQQLGEFRCNGMETTGAGRVVVAAHVAIVSLDTPSNFLPRSVFSISLQP